MKSAVIIVHGIGPTDRYQIQDQFAAELRDALNTETDEERRQRFGAEPPARLGQWHSDVLWPPVSRNTRLEGVRPTAVRVHCDNHGKDVADEPSVDVFEGYWSPIDKEQTNPVRVLNWLMRSIFAPVAHVKLVAPLLKNVFDIGFALLVALLVPTLAVLSLASAYRAYLAFSPATWTAGLALLLGLLGASAVAQSLARLAPLLFVSAAGRSVVRPLLLLAAGLGLVALMSAVGGQSFDIGDSFARLSWLLGATLAGRLLLSLMRDFLVGNLGDVQIYATHNENQRYYMLREKILQVVGDVVLSVLRTKEGLLGAPLYDRVYLVGHSLGATILMDVIIELHRLMMEGGLDEASWHRLRALVTYGSALEKTHYFFSITNPTPSQQVAEFKGDLYGRLFSAEPDAMAARVERGLRPAMFWTNYWYFSDIVANAIATYGHARIATDPPEPGMHYTCLNVQLPSPAGKVWSHSAYLSDRALWHSGDRKRGLASIVASAQTVESVAPVG